MKNTTVKMTDYLSNMLLPGLGFRGTMNNKHVADYFYWMAAIIVLLGVLLKRDIWSVGMYLMIGVVANISLLVCVKNEQKECLIEQNKDLEIELLEGQVNIVKLGRKAHKGLIILILIVLPMLFSYVYTNTPEGTNWWKESREAKSYLTKMYGDHFTIERVEFVRPMLGFNVVSVVHFHPNEHPGKHFKANRAIGGEFADTYTSYALSEEARSVIDGPIKEAFGEDVVYILETAPSHIMRLKYNPNHKGTFVEYINDFTKQYGADQYSPHLEVDISILRFKNYEKMDKEDEANRVIKLGKSFDSMNVPELQNRLKLLYIPEKNKIRALELARKEDFDNNFDINELWNLGEYYNNTVLLYPRDHPTNENIIQGTSKNNN